MKYQINCKICNKFTVILGNVDFNKSCEDKDQRVFPTSEETVAYYKCVSCEFVFTPDFDRWTHSEYTERIYNKEYILADPEYVSARPERNAQTLNRLFYNPTATKKSLLDYGSGNGTLCKKLDKNIFNRTRSHDPFVKKYSQEPNLQYKIVTCFETLEHVSNPKDVVRSLIKYIEPGGVIIFSTLLQKAHVTGEGVGWWYIAPRNGHISIFSATSLKRIWQEVGYTIKSANEFLHIAWNDKTTSLPGNIETFFNVSYETT